MAEIVPLHAASHPAAAANEPYDKLVGILEDLLEEAKAGRLQGMAFTGSYSDGTFSTGHSYSYGQNINLQAGVARLFWRFTQKEVEG
jgi:hypothetical protein